MKNLVRSEGLEECFEIASAATSAEELRNPVYPPARRELAVHGLSCSGKTARQMSRADYAAWDYLIGMDAYNIRNMQRISQGDPDGKIRLLLSFAGEEKDIDDPWYYGNFPGTYAQIERGCRALLDHLKAEGRLLR